MKDKLSLILTFVIVALVGLVVYSNISEQLEIDQSKLPEKVEENKWFQKWITNLKNKGFEIEADEFRLLEENEVYNTQRMWVYSMDDTDTQRDFENTIRAYKEIDQDSDQIVFSPDERGFVDYRYENRANLDESLKFGRNDARYYGVRDNKLIDSKILTCNIDANCLFDRAYFLSNTLFVISEISRPVDKDEPYPPCAVDEVCTYTFKLNLIDLINNSNLIYESKSMELVLADKINDF